jgi:hypothetical protein
MNGALDGPLDALNVSTQRHIRRTPILIDGIFQSDSGMAMMKKTCVVPFPGGRVIAGNITFDTLLAGAYDVGDDFDLSEQKTDDQLQFFPRQMEVNITTSLEMLEVYNVGPNARYRDIDSKLRNAYNTIGSGIAVNQYLPNNKAGYTKLMTGMAEAINDGTTNGWDTTAYTTYGGLTRASYNGALTPYVVNAAGAAIEYDDVTDAIQETSWGDGDLEPNVLLGTPKIYNSFKKRYQVQQRLNESTPVIGFKGFAIENTTFLKSRYCPGQDIATTTKKSNRVAVKFLSTTTKGVIATYPAVSGETLFILNMRKPNVHMHISTAPRYQFGFTGWKLTARNTKISGQVLYAGQFTYDNPSFHGQIAYAV